MQRGKGITKRPTGRSHPEYFDELRAKNLAALLSARFETLSPEGRRKRVIHEQGGACARCKLSTWLGEPLTLEIDHKDGDNGHNSRENLEGLCPNCHSLTPTWRGRNKRKHHGALDVPLLRSDVEGGKSLSQALKDQGRCGKGAIHASAKLMLVGLMSSS